MKPDELDPAIVDSLDRFAVLLFERAVPLGLVAPSDLDRIFERHVLDSLRALGCMEPGDRDIADIGSGAGLPGIPVALARPEARVLLIEPRRKRQAFLELCITQLEIANAEVVGDRAEEARVTVDVCLARAVRDARGSWDLARRLLRTGGRLVYFAGASWDDDQGPKEAGAVVETCSRASFPWQGPLVMISRRSDKEHRGSRR